MKKTFGHVAAVCVLSLCGLPLFGQSPPSPKFPSSTATWQDLLFAVDQSATTLAAGLTAATLSVTVAAGTGGKFSGNQVVTIDTEQMLVCSVASDTLTICPGGRGYAGTMAATHSAGASVRGNYTATHHNRLAAEIKAIEDSLGANMANVGASASAYRFTLTNGVEVSGCDFETTGSKTCTLTRSPRGVAGTNGNHYLYLSGGTGSPEVVLLTGGTCTSGLGTSCTLTFNVSSPHSGAWTLTSATGGIQEAVYAQPEGSTIMVSENTTAMAGVTIVNRKMTIRGTSRSVRLDFASTIPNTGISLIQGGLPAPDIGRFGISDLTIVNASTAQKTISISGIQKSPNILNNLIISGGTIAIDVGGGANACSMRALQIFDPIVKGMYFDVTLGSDFQVSDVIINASTVPTHGIHIEKTTPGTTPGGVYLNTVYSFGNIGTPFLFENSSGTRSDIFVSASSVVADGTYGVAGIKANNASNIQLTHSWCVNHDAGAPTPCWSFHNSSLVNAVNIIGYSEGQGDIAITGGSSDIRISSSTLSGPVRAVYVDTVTPPTNLSFTGTKITGTANLTNNLAVFNGAMASALTVLNGRQLFVGAGTRQKYDGANSTGSTFTFAKTRNGGPVLQFDALGDIAFIGANSASVDKQFALIRGAVYDPNAGTERGSLDFMTLDPESGGFSTVRVRNGAVTLGGVLFANLPAFLENGSLLYCSNCAATSPCTAEGTGRIARRENNQWNCN